MKKQSDPLDTIIECIEVFNEASYEDTDIDEAELAHTKKRFARALMYLISVYVEKELDERNIHEKIKV